MGERFSKALREAAAKAEKEQDVRAAVERQLGLIAQDLNVTLEGKQEYTLLQGQVDSVYGSVFVEYKNPASPSSRLGPKLSSSGTKKAVEQLTGRFADVKTLSAGKSPDLLGVACDGKYFVFARFVAGRVEVDSPAEISRWSSRRFLWALFNLGERGFAQQSGPVREHGAATLGPCWT